MNVCVCVCMSMSRCFMQYRWYFPPWTMLMLLIHHENVFIVFQRISIVLKLHYYYIPRLNERVFILFWFKSRQIFSKYLRTFHVTASHPQQKLFIAITFIGYCHHHTQYNLKRHQFIEETCQYETNRRWQNSLDKQCI